MSHSIAVRQDSSYILSSALTLGLDGTPEAQQQSGSISIYHFDWSDWLPLGDETSGFELSGSYCTPGLFRWEDETLGKSVNVYVKEPRGQALVTVVVSTVQGAKVNIPLRIITQESA